MKTLHLSLLLGAIILAGCTTTTTTTDTTGSGNMIACTMEAKLCPDGSYVGRQLPHCQFAACPGETSSASSVPASY